MGGIPQAVLGGFFGNADLVTAYVAIVTAAATGLWGIKKYVDERRSTREQEQALADRELVQRQYEAREAKQQRAAELIKAVGDAPDASARRWTMSALSLYPDESLDLLLAALREADDEDASAIKVAVISLGRDALPAVVKYHRIAVQLCRIGDAPSVEPGVAGASTTDHPPTSRMLESTREILVHLLLQLDDEERADVDLAGADLSGVSLPRTRLNRAPFRKVKLDHAAFGHAGLRRANLRGASLSGTSFTRAVLCGADLTGAHGSVKAVRVDLSDAVLDRADLSGSVLDAARFHGASLRGTGLVSASLAGANLSGATLERTHLAKATAHHLAAQGVDAKGLDASQTNLADARLDGVRLEDSKLQGASAPRARARDARFVNVNLNGADLEQSDLTSAELRGCVLGGTRLSGAVLDEVEFTSCTFGGTCLAGASLAHARFQTCTFKGTVDLTGTDLSAADFADCRFEPGVRLLVDNVSWRSAGLDETARTAFDSFSASATT